MAALLTRAGRTLLARSRRTGRPAIVVAAFSAALLTRAGRTLLARSRRTGRPAIVVAAGALDHRARLNR